MAVTPGQVPDCVFHGESALNLWSALATDTSGEGADLTAGADYAYETSSTRANLNTRRTMDIGILHDNTIGSGTLFTWDRSSQIDRLNISGAAITVFVDGSSILSYTIQNISGTTEEFVISWAMEPNPDSVDTSDAYRSEIQIYNLDQSTHEQATADHAQPTAGTGTLVFGAQDTSGTGSYGGDTNMIRLSSGFHSSVEQYETFVSQSAAPTLLGDEIKPIPVPVRTDVASGDDGQFSGPILIMGAKASQQNRSILWGPLVNDVNNDGDLIGPSSNGSGYNSGYDFDGTSIRLEHTYYRPVPLGANFVVPYVYVASNEATTTTDLTLSVYSMSQPGPLSKPNSSPDEFEYYSVSDTVDDHGTGSTDGEWVQFSRLKIARDKRGFSYFTIGGLIGSGNTYQVKAVCLDPIFVASGDGLGTGGFSLG